MRIGLIRMSHAAFGGAETFLGRLMDELARQGYEVELFSTGWDEKPRAGLSFREVKASGPRFLRPLAFAVSAGRAVRASGCDVVISLERGWCQDIYRAGDGCHREWLARRGRYISWWKRLWTKVSPFHLVLLAVERKMFSSPLLRMVAANSAMVKADIQRHYGLPEEKICVIYNGISPGPLVGEIDRAAVRAEMGAAEGSVVLLFVGSGFERKGLVYAIRALAQLSRRADVRLAVIGKGRTGRYMREARRLGLLGRVAFLGPRKDARSFYAASDIFVLPSIYEPFSNACLEALAAGLPVVTTRANGASEILEEGVTGSIVQEPSDHAEIAARVGLFLDEGARVRAGQAAKEAASTYTMERNVDGFIRLAEQMRR